MRTRTAKTSIRAASETSWILHTSGQVNGQRAYYAWELHGDKKRPIARHPGANTDIAITNGGIYRASRPAGDRMSVVVGQLTEITVKNSERKHKNMKRGNRSAETSVQKSKEETHAQKLSVQLRRTVLQGNEKKQTDSFFVFTQIG